MELGGRTLSATFTDLADQASGSVIMKYGETVVLVTAVMSSREKEGQAWFPLTVDYEEKYYAAGKILGGRFMKREGRPSDEAVLSGRIIDRTIRPLFDQSMRREIHVVAIVLSIDADNDPAPLAVIGASLALSTSHIPWNGPVSAIKVAELTDGTLAINAPYGENDRKYNILACGKDGNINMVECDAKEAPNANIAAGFQKASEEIEKIQEWQKSIIAERGVEKEVVATAELAEGAEELFASEIAADLRDAAFSNGEKANAAIAPLEDKWKEIYLEKFPEGNVEAARHYFEVQTDAIVHKEALLNNLRVDGRAMDQLRKIESEAGGLSNVVHGVGTFYRGGTHVLTLLTLGGPDDAQLLEGMEVRGTKHFMHHYNFPPFSVGEAGRMGGFNRRAIGHGALAEKALEATLPDREEFPYTIRLVSESTASNGSTSMGSVCASSLALMDGGVPIKRPTAGIAMGLMMDESDPSNYKVLTDIQGPEDHYGDMDFKVAGTTEGVTAIQMDVKVSGVPIPVLVEALEAAQKARLQILDVITTAIPEPRADLAPSAPRIISTSIDPEEIGTVIGSGGKTIKKIQEETGAEISIEEDGRVYVTGEAEGAQKALAMVEEIVHKYKVGEKFEATVDKILDFGAVVKIGYFGEGLVHISEIAPFRIESMEGVLEVGEKVNVAVKELDDKFRPRFSIKMVNPDFAEKKGLKPAPRPEGNSGQGSRGRYNGGHNGNRERRPRNNGDR